MKNIMNFAIGKLYFAKQTKVLSTKEGALKHLSKLTGKHIYRSLFLMKLLTRGLQIYWKETFEFSRLV